MKIGIDVGYGYVKAISDAGQKTSFPAMIAPSGNGLGLGDVFKDTVEYQVAIDQSKYMVGDAAKQSFLATQTMSREKPPEIHDPLLLTAAHLLSGDDDRLEIGVGLPLAYYSAQKGSLKNRLQNLKADVVIGDKHKHISFDRVNVFPQGAGVLLCCQSMLPLNGYVGLIDIGTYTTEYILFQMKSGRPIPVLEASGSVEAGVHLVYSAVAREFQNKTGSPLPVEMEAEVTEKALRGEPVTFDGRKHMLDAIQAREDVALVICQKVLSAWGNRTGHIETTLLAGGGALFFRKDLKGFPGQYIVQDPFFANARGYLGFIAV
ncbi:MAG: ParM/StbA family protein [Syntrophomonadaceae bacterium]|nr:ParM/StbA family protein [Syntrophomonadaceae bacterium]